MMISFIKGKKLNRILMNVTHSHGEQKYTVYWLSDLWCLLTNGIFKLLFGLVVCTVSI